MILDVNDNLLVFSESFFIVIVLESFLVGLWFLNVIVLDVDIGDSVLFMWFIMSGNIGDVMVIELFIGRLYNVGRWYCMVEIDNWLEKIFIVFCFVVKSIE